MLNKDYQIYLVEYFRDHLNWYAYVCSAFVACVFYEYDHEPTEEELNTILKDISSNKYSNNFIVALKKAETLSEAVSVVYCRYSNGFSDKKTIPTEADIKRIDNTYKNGFNLRLKYADQILDNYHRSIDI